MSRRANTLQGLIAPLLSDGLSEFNSKADMPWNAYPNAAVTDRSGNVLASTAAALSPSTGRVVRAVSEFFGDQWTDGDVAICNDADAGTGHGCELALAVSLTLNSGGSDEQVWVVLRANLPDLGGWELGGYSPQAIDRWAEAARFEPAKVAQAGKPRREIREMLALNSRTPHTTLRLVDGLIAAAESIKNRMRAVFEGAALDSLHAAAEDGFEAELEIIDVALDRLAPASAQGRAEISAPFSEPIGTIETALGRSGNKLEVKISAPPVSSRPINLCSATAEDLIVAALVGGLDLGTLESGAFLRRIHFDNPAPSLTAATLPAPIGLGRETTGEALFRSVLAALAAAGCEVDNDTLWQRHLNNQIGNTMDRESGKVSADHAEQVRAYESREATHDHVQG